MPEESVELVRGAIDAINRGDLDAWLDTLHPDFEFQDPPEMPDDSSGSGRKAALASLKRMLDLAEDVLIEVKEITTLDDGRILLATRVSARGAGSGVPVEFDRWDLMTIRDGKFSRAEVYLDRDHALEAAGLAK
jgi:ketosteroid isomerase-like protein